MPEKDFGAMAAYRLYLTDRERLAMAQDLEHRRVSCRQLMALLERRLQEEHPQLAAGRVGPEHWIDQAPGMPEASCDGDETAEDSREWDEQGREPSSESEWERIPAAAAV